MTLVSTFHVCIGWKVFPTPLRILGTPGERHRNQLNSGTIYPDRAFSPTDWGLSPTRMPPHFQASQMFKLLPILLPTEYRLEVKSNLGNITINKASRGAGILVELFKTLKDDAVNVLNSICHQIWKLSNGNRTGKGHFSFQFQRRAMPKNVQTAVQLWSFCMLGR